MKIQQQLATRLYELLPHKNKCVYSLMSCGRIPCKDQEHFDDIRLADLLMAIGNGKIGIDSTGEFLEIEIFQHSPSEITETGVYYNLSKDNILDQSDEFCEFVLELLK